MGSRYDCIASNLVFPSFLFAINTGMHLETGCVCWATMVSQQTKFCLPLLLQPLGLELPLTSYPAKVTFLGPPHLSSLVSWLFYVYFYVHALEHILRSWKLKEVLAESGRM